MKEIPVVDLNDFDTSNEIEFDKSVKVLSQAFHDIGFIFVRAPEITKMLPPIYEQFRRVFDLPHDVKARYAHPEIHYQRGWTPPFQELAIACKYKGHDGGPLPDAKENWFMGPDFPAEHHLVREYPQDYPPNIWPEEVPGLRPAMEELYEILFDLGKRALSVLGVGMGKERDYFYEMVCESPTVMRAIHYPRVTAEQVGNIAWACTHTDINFITVLPASTKPGLWIRRRDGEWIPGNAPEGCVIVQVGDMLQHLTENYFVSAPHEVRAPDKETFEGRLSAALFIHARSDVNLGSITAHEFLLRRLREIGLADS